MFYYFVFKDRSDYTIRQQLVQNILQEKGQALVIKLLHASVFELSSYMLSDVADVIMELTRIDADVCILRMWFLSYIFRILHREIVPYIFY